MLKPTATDAEVLTMGKLAILASSPMGMGFLQHRDDLKQDDVTLAIDGGFNPGLFMDYYHGRMVKFRAWKREHGWEFPDTISGDYESWIARYPSYGALYEAATKADAVDPVGERVTD